MCHSMMGLTRCYKTAVFLHFIKVKVDKSKERFINVNQVTTQSMNLKLKTTYRPTKDFESLAVYERLLVLQGGVW